MLQKQVVKVLNAYLRHHRGDWSSLLRRQEREKKQNTKISGWSREHFKEKTLYLKEDTIIQMKADTDTDLEGQAHSKRRFIHRAVILKHKHASSWIPPTPSLLCLFGWLFDSATGRAVHVSLSRCREGRAALWCYVSDLWCQRGGWGSQVCLSYFSHGHDNMTKKEPGRNPAPVSHLSRSNNHNQLSTHSLIVNAV